MKKNKYFSILDTLKENNSEPMGLNDRVLLVDGLNTFIRSWAVSPVTNSNGAHVGGISGSMLSIGYAIKNIKPTRVIIVFDGKDGSQRRRKLFPDYKAKRKPTENINRSIQLDTTPENTRKNMGMQLGRLGQYLETLPVTMYSIDKIEADDVIAYICKQALPESKHFIMSSDKDFIQLVDDRISVWSPTKKKLYFKEDVQNDFEVPAHNYLTYRLLTGDKSDCIPGIPGAGLKTLQKRLPILFGDTPIGIDEIIEATKDSDYKVGKIINENRDLLEMNHKLMQLDNVDIAGTHKLNILNNLNEVNKFNKFKFQSMLLEDQLTGAIRNHDMWLKNTFIPLQAFKLKKK